MTGRMEGLSIPRSIMDVAVAPVSRGCRYAYGCRGNPSGSTLPARMSLDVRALG